MLQITVRVDDVAAPPSSSSNLHYLRCGWILSNQNRKTPNWIAESYGIYVRDKHGIQEIPWKTSNSGAQSSSVPSFTPSTQKYFSKYYSLHTSTSGRYLVSTLHSGDVFLWDRQRDLIKYLPSPVDSVSSHGQSGGIAGWLTPSLGRKKGNSGANAGAGSGNAFKYAEPWEGEGNIKESNISDDGTTVIVQDSDSNVWLWQCSGEDSFHDEGRWYRTPEDVIEGKDLRTVDFIHTPTLGKCCYLTCGNLSETEMLITTWKIRSDDPIRTTASDSTPSMDGNQRYQHQAEINDEEDNIGNPFPFALTCCFKQRRLFKQNDGVKVRPLVRWDRSGTICAIVLNKTPILRSKVEFCSVNNLGAISTFHYGQHVVNEKHVSADSEDTNWWINDMAWTCNSLFLAAINKKGYVFLLARMGDSLVVMKTDQNMTRQVDEPVRLNQLLRIFVDDPSLPQHGKKLQHFSFSISSHPSIPALICTNGARMVTIQLPKHASSDIISLLLDFHNEVSSSDLPTKDTDSIKSLLLAAQIASLSPNPIDDVFINTNAKEVLQRSLVFKSFCTSLLSSLRWTTRATNGSIRFIIQVVVQMIDACDHPETLHQLFQILLLVERNFIGQQNRKSAGSHRSYSKVPLHLLNNGKSSDFRL
eukprot:TRINITY_DN8966_c0_g1_i1.p1 TRINITY_DN8966_c0_g1~~TRINITY_DN8966_c0_g1_i1.p1  ORF type:complete len:643 (+),score=137.29 TRINITY_DN8966_c0_g1_i1:112-2040(+)